MLFTLEKQKSRKYMGYNEADAVSSEYLYTNLGKRTSIRNMVLCGGGRGGGRA